MSYDPSKGSNTTTYATTQVDAGLQAYMRQVYNTMGFGLVTTAIAAYAVAQIQPLYNLIFGTPLAFVVMFAPLAFVLFGFSPSRLARMPVSQIRLMFYAFSGLMGLSMAYIFKAYTDTSIVRVFFITAGMFAATSIYGYTTKKDLTGMGSFMMMGLWGLIIASVVNIFLGSTVLQFAVSAVGVVVFTGLAAYETQNIKETYAYGNQLQQANDKMAVMGALRLYLSFVNLFQSLLHLFGDRR